MTKTDVKKRLGGWYLLDEVRGDLENWREEMLMRIDSAIFDLAADFVERNKGDWNHQGWEGFLEEIKGEDYELGGDLADHVGLILERFKLIYKNGGLLEAKAAFGKKSKKADSKLQAKDAASAAKIEKKTETKPKSGKAKTDPSKTRQKAAR